VCETGVDEPSSPSGGGDQERARVRVDGEVPHVAARLVEERVARVAARVGQRLPCGECMCPPALASIATTEWTIPS